MKAFLISFSFLVGLINPAKSQNGSCTMSDDKQFDTFIAGYVDTIQANGLKVRAIYAVSLMNGFELICRDSLVRIEQFRLTFDDSSGNLYLKSSFGSKMLDDQTNLVPLQKLRNASLITIDNIILRYNGLCYRTKAQVYFCR